MHVAANGTCAPSAMPADLLQVLRAERPRCGRVPGRLAVPGRQSQPGLVGEDSAVGRDARCDPVGGLPAVLPAALARRAASTRTCGNACPRSARSVSGRAAVHGEHRAGHVARRPSEPGRGRPAATSSADARAGVAGPPVRGRLPGRAGSSISRSIGVSITPGLTALTRIRAAPTRPRAGGSATPPPPCSPRSARAGSRRSPPSAAIEASRRPRRRTPPPCSAAATSRATRNEPTVLIREHLLELLRRESSSAGDDPVDPGGSRPARPARAAQQLGGPAPAAATTAARRVTSQTTGCGADLRGGDRQSVGVPVQAATTPAPLGRRSRHTARPIPEPPPVTSAGPGRPGATVGAAVTSAADSRR